MTDARTGLTNAAKFILCAVPGALILLIVPLVLLVGRIAPPDLRALEVAGGIAAIPIGGALILYGTNNWGKWGYVLPMIAVLPWMLLDHPPTAVSLALLMLPFVTAWAVRRYYKRRGVIGQP